jgi:hypothetical protein
VPSRASPWRGVPPHTRLGAIPAIVPPGQNRTPVAAPSHAAPLAGGRAWTAHICSHGGHASSKSPVTGPVTPENSTSAHVTTEVTPALETLLVDTDPSPDDDPEPDVLL